MNSIAEKFGRDEVNYLAIGRDGSPAIEDFLQKHPWNFDHIPDGNGLIQDHFKIRWGFPTTFVLNKNAEIILAFSGGKSDRRAVQEIQDKLIPVIEAELGSN